MVVDLWTDTHPPKFTGVHRATFPFLSANVIWAFSPVGSDVYMMLGLFRSTRSYLGILPVDSDVYLMLRTICGHWLLFGHFCQLVLTSIYHWGPFLSIECHLGILPIGSDIWLPLRVICVGEVFVWDSVPVTNGEGLWQLCCLMCDWVFHLCDWHYCCLCKMRKSGSSH